MLIGPYMFADNIQTDLINTWIASSIDGATLNQGNLQKRNAYSTNPESINSTALHNARAKVFVLIRLACKDIRPLLLLVRAA